jgi:hypothetical protein
MLLRLPPYRNEGTQRSSKPALPRPLHLPKLLPRRRALLRRAVLHGHLPNLREKAIDACLTSSSTHSSRAPHEAPRAHKLPTSSARPSSTAYHRAIFAHVHDMLFALLETAQRASIARLLSDVFPSSRGATALDHDLRATAGASAMRSREEELVLPLHLLGQPLPLLEAQHLYQLFDLSGGAPDLVSKGRPDLSVPNQVHQGPDPQRLPRLVEIHNFSREDRHSDRLRGGEPKKGRTRTLKTFLLKKLFFLKNSKTLKTPTPPL